MEPQLKLQEVVQSWDRRRADVSAMAA